MIPKKIRYDERMIDKDETVGDYIDETNEDIEGWDSNIIKDDEGVIRE